MKKNDWENQHITRINTVAMHSPLGAFASLEEARVSEPETSENFICLNGKWKFYLADKPCNVPKGFYSKKTEELDWNTISVPGNWELNGYLSPIYRIQQYPFQKYKCEHFFVEPGGLKEGREPDIDYDLNPPYVPEDNPTGCYSIEFNVKKAWLGKNIFISFQGVESAFYLWINGEMVGYSQDSRLPAEFDISNYISVGANCLSLMVLRWSDGTYLERQDNWTLTGINRDVFLYCKPKEYIRDFKVIPIITEEGNGIISAYCYTNITNYFSDKSIEMYLYDSNNNYMDKTRKITVSCETPLNKYNDEQLCEEYGAAFIKMEVKKPKLWSSEKPNLYKLVFVLYDAEGQPVDFENVRIGFRTVELIDDVLCLNGERLILRGVNRHEHDARTGRYVTKERMEQEIKAIKALNFNAVRTCHYPNSSTWYNLCDKYGIYVIDEANIETHGIQGQISQDTEWAGVFLDRMTRMVLRDKNHPSILFWSLGNESSVGINHAVMSGWCRYYDPYRLVLFDEFSWNARSSDVKDLRYQMFLKHHENENRNIILAEYAYSAGNSNGNLEDYWERIRRYKNISGAFVWDWSDRSIAVKQEDGTEKMTLPSDFEGNIDKDYYALTGITDYDLNFHPGAYELKNVQSPIYIDNMKKDRLKIILEDSSVVPFLHHIIVNWELVSKGNIIDEGSIQTLTYQSPRIAACKIESPYYDDLDLYESYLNVRCVLKSDLIGRCAGDEICRRQFRLDTEIKSADKKRWLPDYFVNKADYCSCDKVRNQGHIIEKPDTISLLNGTAQIVVCRKTGNILSYRLGHLAVINGLKENYYRAPTSIDKGGIAEQWERAGLAHLREEMVDYSIRDSDAIVELFVRKKMEGGINKVTSIQSKITYMLHNNGELIIKNSVDINTECDWLPRIGLEVIFNETFSEVEWYGRGPMESYCDRKNTAFMGLYKTYVNKTICPYLIPSECGGREDVHYLTVSNGRESVGIYADKLFHFNAHKNGTKDFAVTKHNYELPNRNSIYICLDSIHCGVGGDDGWSRNVHKEFRIPIQPYQYVFHIKPIKTRIAGGKNYER